MSSHKAYPAPENGGKPHNQHSAKTLRDIMGSISKLPELSERRRRRLLSALNVVARSLGKDPSDIVAQPAALQKALGEVNYHQAGLTKERWRDVRSLTLTALQLGGVKLLPGRRARSEFTPAWTALRRSANTSTNISLSKFENFCCARGIEPPDVTLTTFEAFLDELENHSLVRGKPKTLYHRACKLWDRASETVEGWPPFKIGVPPSSHRYSLPWTAYPASFTADVEAFLKHGGNQNIFATNYAQSVRPATTLGRRKALRVMAAALIASGFAIEQLTSLAVLVHPDNATTILQFFYDRAGQQKKESIYSHACLLRTIARHWVKTSDLKTLDDLCGKLAKKNHGMTERNRSRLRQFDNEENLAALLMLPAKLVRLAHQHDNGGENAPFYGAYAAAIELLCAAPIRVKNLTELEIGRTVILPADMKRGRIMISIPPEEVKNDEPIEFELPRPTSEFIFQYLREFRPRMSPTASPWLFPNELGGRRNTQAFSHQIGNVILSHTGLEVHSHLFRHLAVKILLAENPDALETARRLLGHKSIITTSRAYSEGKTTVAQQRYTDLIENKRNSFTPKAPSDRPRKNP